VKLDESSNVLRKAAVTAYQAGNEERIGTVKNQWYRQALAYYEMLCQKNDPSYEDRLGRALLLRVLGKYRDSTDVLEEMKIDYPKDYKVQMWICYNYLDEASEEGTYSNVSGDLKFTYHSCRNLYENRADRSEEDPDMEMLEETMKELE
jgi:tetratricopeptide (TPR) repeat protein